MAGWIKLWRKLKENGHLKMPGVAFKLWIFCLLEASPCRDKARGLEVGELLLNYEQIRQVIGENNRQMSKSTVSAALKYLEQNGYLKLEPIRFYGIKARVANWRLYQSTPGTETVPGESPRPEITGTKTVPGQPPWPPVTGTETVLGEPPCPWFTGTETVLGEPPRPGYTDTENVTAKTGRTPAGTPSNAVTGAIMGTPTGTETVPAKTRFTPEDTPPGTVTGTVTGTPTGTETVPVTALGPYSPKASGSAKNIRRREYKNIDPTAAAVAGQFEKEFGRPLSPVEIEHIADWLGKMSPEMIREALARAVLKDKRNMAYVSGILRDWLDSGVTTLEQAGEQDEKHRRANRKNGRYKLRDPCENWPRDEKKRRELINQLYNR